MKFYRTQNIDIVLTYGKSYVRTLGLQNIATWCGLNTKKYTFYRVLLGKFATLLD